MAGINLSPACRHGRGGGGRGGGEGVGWGKRGGGGLGERRGRACQVAISHSVCVARARSMCGRCERKGMAPAGSSVQSPLTPPPTPLFPPPPPPPHTSPSSPPMSPLPAKSIGEAMKTRVSDLSRFMKNYM